jgi:hypothetical protein
VFRKVKVFFIVLLILSLSFVPSVNSASDIFNEKQHLSYNTLKSRMTDYINTPDYFKPYTPPVIYSNEYVNFEDYIDAAEDLFSIPLVDNSTLNEISVVADNIPLFKDLNVRFIELLKWTKAFYRSDEYMSAQDLKFKRIYDPDLYHQEEANPQYGEAEHDGHPYGEFEGVLEELSLYVLYKSAANDLKNAITDSMYFFDKPNMDLVFNPDNIIIVEGVPYTARELFSRISTSRVGLNGRYEFSNTAPLASGDAPTSVGVASTMEIMNDNYVILNSGNAVTAVNYQLQRMGVPEIIELPQQPPVDFLTSKSNHPEIILQKDASNTKFILTKDYIHNVNPIENLAMDGRGNPVDITPGPVSQASKALELTYNAEGKVVTETEITNRSEYFPCVAEVGFMFIFAVICFITAWVYR